MDHRVAELQALKNELLARNERTHQHIHQREDRLSANFADQSQEMDNQELVLNLDIEGRDEVRQIDAALARISEGCYGKCTECGDDIDGARLDALPYTPFCIACAQKQE